MAPVRYLEFVCKDAQYAARALRRSPGFASIALITLALGIGANTAIFSVVKAVLLNPLPYGESRRLFAISETTPISSEVPNVDYTTAAALRNQSRSFEYVSAFRDGPGVLTENGVAEMLRGLSVDYDFFDALGVRMTLGRNFNRQDQQEGRRLVMILSHKQWVERFGADPDILGRVLDLSGFNVTVIGVLPAAFEPLLKATSEIPPQIYYPLPCNPRTVSRNCESVRLIGRLHPGVHKGEAVAEANAIFETVASQNPAAHRDGARLGLTPVREVILGRFSGALWIVWAAAVFILLIACANVANLVLARGTSRTEEIAVRMALGASRAKIARHLLTESLFIAICGGGLGMLLAIGGVRGLASLIPAQIPRASSAHIDAIVLIYALGATVACGLLFGLVPAWRGARLGLERAIRGSTSGRLRDAIVVVEIGLAFVLTVGTGLMIQTFAHLQRVGPGYDARNVLTLTTSIISQRYGNNRVAYYREAIARLRRIPGIDSVAFSNVIPMDYTDVARFYSEERPVGSASDAPVADRLSVSTDYFRVMRIPLVGGRLFTEDDDEKAPKVAVINAACARAQFAGEDPIGKRVRLGVAAEAPWMTIVGVVGDVRQDGIDRPADMQVYAPLNQGAVIGFYRLLARTAGEPMRDERPVRSVFAEIDAGSPVYHVKPLGDYLAQRLADRTLALNLLALFDVLALFLAGVGVYGVMAYSARLRTREIGIRMALGADAPATVRLILRDSLVNAAIGIGFGLIGAFLLTRFLATLLFQMRPTDPTTLGVVAILLGVVTLAAALMPARRAALTDPMAVLRQQ